MAISKKITVLTAQKTVNVNVMLISWHMHIAPPKNAKEKKNLVDFSLSVPLKKLV
jgi:hypothetical protein